MAESTIAIRPIAATDDAAVAGVIRAVMPEFGASGDGFAMTDAEVDTMSVAYGAERCCYFVVELDGRVAGGAGVAPLVGADGTVCELRKMYFLPELRGRGVGRELLARCLEAAREMGFARCYIETLTGMDAAQRLYRAAGFELLAGPLGNTGHHGCDLHLALEL
ncbi:GNAT family N-acetyltransferase [Engelhardtia mirabilis]|uniref:Acetyltransferase (GNAT) family protein n=1 Tax=Engelhardtia mirabilis TaxID=2528011 RepID=A0A518BLL5_9BACT|nr:Acetyltransferase (GNAT) family protein [Planctomycetes bacterium Pla133]QDV02195.1 Acetyltransferase (GNAT) family protein [Planctomycetes bacterium Pla86]